jgi:hypothetical protein
MDLEGCRYMAPSEVVPDGWERQLDQDVPGVIKYLNLSTARFQRMCPTAATDLLDPLTIQLLKQEKRRLLPVVVAHSYDDQGSDGTAVPSDLAPPQQQLEVQSCVICMEEPKVMVCVPCGHRCMCTGCSHDLTSKTSSSSHGRCCPLCRKKVLLTIHVPLDLAPPQQQLAEEPKVIVCVPCGHRYTGCSRDLTLDMDTSSSSRSSDEANVDQDHQGLPGHGSSNPEQDVVTRVMPPSVTDFNNESEETFRRLWLDYYNQEDSSFSDEDESEEDECCPLCRKKVLFAMQVFD